MVIKAVKIVCLIILTISISIMAIYIAILAHTVTGQLTVTIDNLNKALVSIQAIETNTTRTEAEMSGLLNTTRHIAISEQAATKAQLAIVTKIGNDIDNLVTHANMTIDAAADDEHQLGKLLDTTTISIIDITNHSNIVLDNAAEAIDSKDINRVMANIADSSVQVKIATTEAAASMTDVHQGIDYELNQLEKPVKKVKVVAEEAVRLIGRFLGY